VQDAPAPSTSPSQPATQRSKKQEEEVQPTAAGRSGKAKRKSAFQSAAKGRQRKQERTREKSYLTQVERQEKKMLEKGEKK